MGTKRCLSDFVDDNAFVDFHPCDRILNHTAIIRKNDDVVAAINSALEIDLSGQGVRRLNRVPELISGIGGQMDFIRGSALSSRGVASRSSRCRLQREAAACRGSPRNLP